MADCTSSVRVLRSRNDEWDALFAERTLFRRPRRHRHRQAGEERHAEVYLPPGPVHQHANPRHFRAARPNRIEDLADAASGGQDIIDDEDPVAGADFETTLELAPRAVLFALRDDGPEPQVASCVIAEDDPASCRARNEVHLP